jgi:hypothetical protein
MVDSEPGGDDMDRREFLTGSMGASVLAALPADDAFAQRGAPPQPRAWDCGPSAASSADSQRHEDRRQGLVPISPWSTRRPFTSAARSFAAG